ncbi:MAG: ankyrin repeat domain-containing protein, partial [Spirochaetaceae bacterium]|nr:ankyrin repeat domain-containing protein [Spirochaetaceae bacterium]
QDNFGNSPASLSMKSTSSMVKALLTSKNVNMPAINNVPILHSAAESGLYELLPVILTEEADINLIDTKGRTALDAALSTTVKLENIECAAVLLKSGALQPETEDWQYITEPLRTGNLEIRFDYGLTALQIAAEHGHEGMIRYLLANGADIDSRDQPGNTALHVAVRKGYRTIATLLLDAGSDVNVRDYNGNAPIHESLTANDSFAMTTMLLDRGADPNLKNGTGSTPLHMTVLLRTDISGAQLLIKRGAEIDPRDRSGDTPLMLAVNAGDRSFSEMFLADDADIFARNNQNETPAEGAISYGAEVCSWFFTGKRLNQTDNEGKSVLHLATAMEVEPVTLKVLLDAGSLPNLRDSNGESALHYAVKLNNIPLAVTMLNNNADPFLENNEGLSPLIQAFDHGPDFTVAFLSNRIDMEDRWGGTPLFHAVHWEYPDIVIALISSGANPNYKNHQESTPLHEAVHTGSMDIASILLDSGADPDTGDNMGHTPVHDAVSWGAFDILKLLSNYNAQLNSVDNAGQTALHMSSFSGNEEITAWLLKAGANPDIRDDNGHTPLFIAVESDRTNTARLLIDKGANLQTRDKNGRTALHTAISRRHTSSTVFLIKSGSDIFAVDGMGITAYKLAMEAGSPFLESIMDKTLVRRQDNMGNTALHLAVIAEAGKDIIDVLIDKGADKMAGNASGKTPFDLAKDMGNEELESWVR